MSFLDDEGVNGRSSWSRRVGRIVIGLLLVSLVSVGGKAVGFFAVSGVGSVVAASRQVTADQVDRELASLQEMAETRAVLREHYPDVWQTMIEEIASAGGSENAQQAGVALFHRMRRLMVDKRSSIIAAPDGDLVAIARNYAALSEALRASDVSLCASFFMQGFSPGLRLDPAIVALADRVTASQLRAAHHAENGQRSARRPATDSDFGSWFQSIERTSPESATLFAEEKLETSQPQQQCDASVAMWKAAAALPTSQSAVVTATLMDDTLRSM